MQADGAGWNARDGSGAGDQILLAEARAGLEGERDEGLKSGGCSLTQRDHQWL
jgi:hypothetical protein